MPDLGVRLLIEAENRASAELEKLRLGFTGITRESESTGKTSNVTCGSKNTAVRVASFDTDSPRIRICS